MGGFSLARKTRIDARFRGREAIVLALALCCSACASTPDSGRTPFQAAFFNPIQIFSEETNVHGFRMNLPYGSNADFRGLDLGMVGVAKNTKGAQINFFYNEAEALSGVQLAGLPGNLCVDLDGVQVGVINTAEGQVRGWQLSFFFNDAGDVKGGQISGLYNRGRNVVGFQAASLVNEAENLRGLQIGALNFNNNGILPVFPVFNFGFWHDTEKKPSDDEASSDTDE